MVGAIETVCNLTDHERKLLLVYMAARETFRDTLLKAVSEWTEKAR